MNDDRQIVTAWLPRDLYLELRAAAYDQHTTMTKIMIDALTDKLREARDGVPE